MTAKNDVLENEEVKATGLPPQEELIMSQEDLIAGLFAAADYENDDNLIKTVEIKRGDRIFFRFNVRPLSENELVKCRKASTTMKRNPQGRNLPKVEDINYNELRTRKIYEATCDEDKEKLWDNPQVKAGLNARGKTIVEGWEIIDEVLLAGEKYKVSELIDKISGFDDEEDITLEEYAKN